MKPLGYIGGYKTSTRDNNKIAIKFIQITTDTKEEILEFQDKKDFWYREINPGDSEKIQADLEDVFEEEFLTEEDSPLPEELQDIVDPDLWQTVMDLNEWRWQNQGVINEDKIITEYLSKKFNTSHHEIERQLEALYDYKEKEYNQYITEAFNDEANAFVDYNRNY